ncbi:hypothetical protein [Paenibacillus elgii]|uniref:hypothetical protein n=1 Tax=Paenibacillus elgii TaxID=189691 RepID=UPI001C3F89B9|nr:hypothetical protein [Paenibacillus elgii]
MECILWESCKITKLNLLSFRENHAQYRLQQAGIFSEKPISAYHFAIYWYYCACWIQILEKISGEKHGKLIFTKADNIHIGTGFMLGVQINDEYPIICSCRIRNNDPDGDAGSLNAYFRDNPEITALLSKYGFNK